MSVKRLRNQSMLIILLTATGALITAVAGASAKDVDLAVEAAAKAYKTSWGLKVPGTERGRLLNKLADLMEEHADHLVALDCLNVGAFGLDTNSIV